MTTLGRSVEEIAAAIASGEISAAEAATVHLDALARVDKELNAVARLEPEAAAAAAAEKDAAAASTGPLHGVPLAHKDIYGRAGWLHEAGSAVLAGNRAAVTSSSLTSLDEAGALDIGRLNTVEFALGPAGLNDITGAVKNPWNTEHITGGSSSGSGACVAAGAVPAALGSDTGGSIRLPAAACGVVGIKPTAGRIGRTGVFPAAGSLDTVGPLATTVRDAAILLEVMCRHDPADPQSVDLPAPGPLATIEDGLAGLTIGVAREYFFDPVTTAVGAALEGVISLTEREGGALSDVAFPDIALTNRFTMAIIGAEAAAVHRPWIETRAAQYGPQTLERLVAGLFIPASAYIAALHQRHAALAAALDGPFAAVDVVLVPAIPFEVPKITDPSMNAEMIGYTTRPFNYLGLPCMVIPIGVDGAGLPIAVQLVARPFEEATLLRAARALERALAFRESHTPGITA